MTQKFNQAEANAAFGQCSCPDDSGSCDWCQVYYWGWGCEGCGLTIPTCECSGSRQGKDS